VYLIHALLAAICLFLALTRPGVAQAQETPTLIIGEIYLAKVIYCTDKQDAREIAESILEGSDAALEAMLKQKFLKARKEDGSGFCTFRMVGFQVVRLAAALEKDDKKMNVIEVRDPTGTYYVLLPLKVVRNSFLPKA
jgi:hypothetical protein